MGDSVLAPRSRECLFVDILKAKALVSGCIFVSGAFVFILIINEGAALIFVNVCVARGSESN
jgi:hypothetical protein